MQSASFALVNIVVRLDLTFHPTRSPFFAPYSGEDSNEATHARRVVPSARGNGNKSFLQSIVSVINPIMGVRKEGHHGERPRRSRRCYQPPACPRMHGLGRDRRAMDGFKRR